MNTKTQESELMKKLNDAIGLTSYMFKSEIQMQALKQDAIEALKQMMRSQVYKPTSFSIQNQFGTLCIFSEWYLKDLQTTNENMQRARDSIVKAINAHLSDELMMKYESMTNLLIHIKSNRVHIKFLATIVDKPKVVVEKLEPDEPAPKATYTYMMARNGDALCPDCFPFVSEEKIKTEGYMWVQEEHYTDRPPICDRCNCSLDEGDMTE